MAAATVAAALLAQVQARMAFHAYRCEDLSVSYEPAYQASCDRLRVITEYSLGASRRGRDIMNLSKQLCESQALLGASKCSETDSEGLQVLLQVPLVTVCPAPPSAPRQNSKFYRHDAANAFHSLSVIPLRHGTQPLYRSSVPCRNLPRTMSETF